MKKPEKPLSESSIITTKYMPRESEASPWSVYRGPKTVPRAYPLHCSLGELLTPRPREELLHFPYGFLCMSPVGETFHTLCQNTWQLTSPHCQRSRSKLNCRVLFYWMFLYPIVTSTPRTMITKIFRKKQKWKGLEWKLSWSSSRLSYRCFAFDVKRSATTL